MRGQSTTGGGVVPVKFGMAKFGAEEIWHQFLTTTGKFGIKFPDCGTASVDHELWLLLGYCVVTAPGAGVGGVWGPGQPPPTHIRRIFLRE